MPTPSDVGKRRILLLGAGGQVGRALRLSLGDLGTLTALGRADLDITDDARIVAVLRDTAPDLVVNAAAYTFVDRAESEPELAHAINGRAPGVLARAAKAAGASFVHYSTDYVFDGTSTVPWPEDATPAPLNVYGRSKLAGEQAIEAVGAAALIIRTAWVYAVGGKNFVEAMLTLGAERERLSIVDDQFGAPTSATVIAELTAGIVSGCGADIPGSFHAAGGVVHLTCDGATSWLGFAEEIFRQARGQGVGLRVGQLNPTSSAEFGAPARRPQNSRLDCRRLAECFGLHPPHWQQALEQYFEERSESS